MIKGFGGRVRQLRKEYEITIMDLAEMIGVSKMHISLIENNKRGVSIETLVNISDLFKVSPNYLLGVKDAKRPYLNKTERELIEKYDSLNYDGRKKFRYALDKLTNKYLKNG